MVQARRKSSTKLYETYIDKWNNYCKAHSIDVNTATVTQGLDFLAELFAEGNRKYSAMNTARSALSLVIVLPNGVQFGKHPDVTQFMKGIFNIKPTVPRYLDTWDPNDVLDLLAKWSPAHRLSLRLLTYKTIVLILLVTGQRPQIIPKLSVEKMHIGSSSYKFELDHTDLKQGRKNFKVQPLRLKKYAPNKHLCVYHYLSSYLNRTLDMRGQLKSVFITTRRPFTTPSADSVSRWVKKVLRHAGINTAIYGAGSTRAASTSKADRMGLSIDQILQAGGWTRTSTFQTYYNKPLKSNNTFAETVLKRD